MKMIQLPSTIDGGVIIPFTATCRVNGQPFSGRIICSWKSSVVPEYDSLRIVVESLCRKRTTCENLALDIRALLPRGDFTVRVEVTNAAHLPAWSVAK